MAKHSLSRTRFKPIGASAVSVLARFAARNIIKEQLREQGVRLSLVPIRQITEQAQVYLEQHPELYQQAWERARQLGMIDLLPPIVTPDKRYVDHRTEYHNSSVDNDGPNFVGGFRGMG